MNLGKDWTTADKSQLCISKRDEIAGIFTWRHQAGVMEGGEAGESDEVKGRRADTAKTGCPNLPANWQRQPLLHASSGRPNFRSEAGPVDALDVVAVRRRREGVAFAHQLQAPHVVGTERPDRG